MKLTSIVKLAQLRQIMGTFDLGDDSFRKEIWQAIQEIKYRREQVISQQKTINRLMEIIEGKDERLAIQSPDVVRCKDCAYLGNSEKCIVQKYISEHPKIIWLLSWQADWFCADGKPKDFID